jgi:hypothetical protein
MRIEKKADSAKDGRSRPGELRPSTARRESPGPYKVGEASPP